MEKAPLNTTPSIRYEEHMMQSQDHMNSHGFASILSKTICIPMHIEQDDRTPYECIYLFSITIKTHMKSNALGT